MTTTSTNGKGVTIRAKDLGIILTFATIIIGSIVDSALTRDQVKRNAKDIEDIKSVILRVEVISTNQDRMADDIKEIKTDVKSFAVAFQEYIANH
jgi:hypothetical protein